MDEEIKRALDSLKEEVNDLRESLDEKDYQILHIMNELDTLKAKI